MSRAEPSIGLSRSSRKGALEDLNMNKKSMDLCAVLEHHIVVRPALSQEGEDVWTQEVPFGVALCN